MSPQARVFVREVLTEDEAQRTGLAMGKYCIWLFPEGVCQLMHKPVGERTFRLFVELTEEV